MDVLGIESYFSIFRWMCLVSFSLDVLGMVHKEETQGKDYVQKGLFIGCGGSNPVANYVLPNTIFLV